MKMSFRRYFLFLIGFSASFPQLSQADTAPATATPGRFPEVIVTAHRLQLPVSQTSSSVEVITREDLKRLQAGTVLDALRMVPGLDTLLSGPRGQNVSLMLRGANTEHTLVLLDGIPLNDPISIGRLFGGLDHISVEQIDRIEVVRGPLSPLYGSSAMGGVVNILTRKDAEGYQGALGFEGGSYGTFRESASFSGGDAGGHVSLALTRFDTDGFSAADKALGNVLSNADRETTFSFALGGAAGPEWSLGFSGRYNKAHTELDDFGGAYGDDPDYHADSDIFIFKTTSDLSLLQGDWRQSLTFSFTDEFRNYQDDPNDIFDIYGFVRDRYRGSILQGDWQNTLRLFPEETLVMGLQAHREWGFNTADYGYGPSSLAATGDSGGFYLESLTELPEGLVASLGGRVDAHSSFGAHGTYRAGLAYRLPGSGLRLKANYGTAFKTPSLYQLYSFYGEPNLLPEENAGWDAGFDWDLENGRVKAGATYFQNDFRELIEFNSGTSKYYNVGEAWTKGCEVSLAALPLEGFQARASYTYTEAWNKTQGTPLLRRPWHKVGLDLSYGIGPFQCGVNAKYVGVRKDFNYPSVLLMGEYLVMGLTASYQLDERLRLYGRVVNLLDEVYEEVYGYGTAGRSYYAGTQVSF